MDFSCLAKKVLFSSVIQQSDHTYKVSLFTGNIAQVGIYVDSASAENAALKASEAVNAEAAAIENIEPLPIHVSSSSSSPLESSFDPIIVNRTLNFVDCESNNDPVELMEEVEEDEEKKAEEEEEVKIDQEHDEMNFFPKPAPTAARRELKSHQIPIEGLLHAGSTQV
jgi:hypothetical protein